jgi:hypothetical protein
MPSGVPFISGYGRIGDKESLAGRLKENAAHGGSREFEERDSPFRFRDASVAHWPRDTGFIDFTVGAGIGIS